MGLPAAGQEAVPAITDAEREVADLLPIDAPPDDAERVRESVPLWFHTFALNRDNDVYTPGIARDHRYRVPAIPASFEGERVLDVGAFDAFYSFLAEHRGAEHVVALDNEQYVEWVRGRFGIELEGGAGFDAISDLIDSQVEYVRGDAREADSLGDAFDVVLCFGILQRVEDPVALLGALHRSLAPGGRIILEAYGSTRDPGDPALDVHRDGDVYAGDNFVYWGFTVESLTRLGRMAGFEEFRTTSAPVVAGHPRVLGELTNA